MINYGRQSINKKDIGEVVKVLKSNFLTQGPMIEKFEKRLKKYCKNGLLAGRRSICPSKASMDYQKVVI